MSTSDGQSKRLSGQVCIVTGGASGIGQATCNAMAREGANVVVVDIDEARIAKTISGLDEFSCEKDAHLGQCVDIRDEQAVERMSANVLERFGRIDVQVACAAVLRGRGSSPKPIHQISVEEWDQVLDTNLKGMFLTNRAVLPTMMKQRRGEIINLSSVSGKKGMAHDGPYCASKFGVIGMSEALAEEVRSYGIRVQLVVPDAVDTPIWDQNGPVPCPPDALSPDRVAELILYMLTLPRDTTLASVTIAPFKTRRRRKKPASSDRAAGTMEASVETGS